MKIVNLVLVVRNEIEREGLKRILADQPLSIAGCHGDPSAVDLEEYPDQAAIILVDLATRLENLEACRLLRARWPNGRIVVFAEHSDSQTVADAFLAGAEGYVAKQTVVSSLGKKLMLVALGEKVVPADVFLDLSMKRPEARLSCESSDLAAANLSGRELQILERLVYGDANKVISRSMAITEATVKVHVKAILRKLAVVNRTQAAIWGVSHGLGVVPGGPAATPALGMAPNQPPAQPGYRLS